MKTCLYRPITLNIIAYLIFPLLYDIQPSLDSYIELAHFNGTLLIDNLTDNTKTTYLYVSMIDFASYAGKHIRISNSNQLGNIFVGEWNIEGTPLPEIEMPDSIKEHMVLWYDIARQGATNESMAANPVLKDLSGNGHNGECMGFDWTTDSGIKQRWSFINTDTDVTQRMYYTTDSNLEVLNITGVKESQNMYDLLKGNTIGTELTREYWCKFDVTGLTDLVSKYPDVLLTFYDGMTSTKRLTEDGTYEYSGLAFIGGGTLSLQYTKDIPIGDGIFNLTIKQYSQSTGALVSDGVDDWVYVPNLPKLTTLNGFTVIALRKRLGDPSTYAAFASKASDATETDGAFIIERFDSNGDTNNVRVRSFGAVTNIVEATDDILWCTSHLYQGSNLTVGDDEDSTELALFKFSCNPTELYCGKYAMYKFLLFDKDLSEKEIIWVLTLLMGIDLNFVINGGATINSVDGNALTVEDNFYGRVKVTAYRLNASYYFLGDSYSSVIGDYGWVSITEQIPSGTQIFVTSNYQQNISGETRSISIPYTINYINPDISDVNNLPVMEKVLSDSITIIQDSLPITPVFKTATEAVAGDAVLYDQTNDHLVIVNSDDVAKCATGYTPVGIVVVPGNHDVYGDGSCGVMSLKEMNCDTPDTGSAQYQGIRWGLYKYDLDIPNYTTVTRGNTEDGSTTGDATYYSYLPSDKFSALQCLHDTDAYYYSSDILSYQPGPSPYKTDGSRNLGYSQTNPPSSSSNALSDFNGRSNSKILWDNATAQSNWKIAPTIINEHNDKYSPAACCCWRYHTEGTQQGDWYLPAEGELGYVIAPFNKINEAINNVQNVYDSFVGVVLSTDGNYWSSSLFSNSSACRVFLEYGEVHTYYNKGNNCYVRAFLKVNDSMLQPKPTYNFIDLGLPSDTLWCDRNIGASSPEDAGLYFQWGDTQGYTAEQVGNGEGQKAFSWADYKFSIDGSSTNFSKYNETDGKAVLDLEDDAARVNMGDSWRMPMLGEYEELCLNTDIYLVPTEGEEIQGTAQEQDGSVIINWASQAEGTLKGVKFYKKGDKQTYIFVPASGGAHDGSVQSVGEIGGLWSSSLYSSYVQSTWLFSFYALSGLINKDNRYFGVPVRGVIPGGGSGGGGAN